LISTRVDGYALPREFYVDETVYRADLHHVWRQGWLFAGHTCQVPNPGDYLTFDLDCDPIVVIRDHNGDLNAFHNICRHRGTVLCDQHHGNTRQLVCPYHQWTYACDGELLSCRGMHDQVDKRQLGLQRIPLRELEGLIFISLAEQPLDFRPAAELIGAMARPQGFHQARVAKLIDYEVAANWKIVWENNRECYHCHLNHPQYIKANFDRFDANDTSARIRENMSKEIQRHNAKWAGTSIAINHQHSGIARFPDAEKNVWYSANRTVLADGFVTESLDGQRVAPLMGEYLDSAVGTLRIRTMPNMWNHSSCDHAVTTQMFPAGARKTRIRVMWLVNADAVEGRDYQLESLLPFWQLTSEQDWRLCERVQRGVVSSSYEPGPLSRHKEYNVESFTRWYLHQLSSAS
jgi:Rieske 2Fe-2S family protein